MWTVLIVIGFIIFDVITGILKSINKGNLNSTELRKGLIHKTSEILAVAGSALLEYVCAYIEFGVELPLIGAVSVYICLMELISIIENLSEVSPLLKKLFGPYLEKLKAHEKE